MALSPPMAAIETEKETTTLLNLLICNEIFALNFAIESNLQSTMSNLDFFIEAITSMKIYEAILLLPHS